MPSQRNSNENKDDLEFERLLYLASILQVRRSLPPTKVGKAQQLSSAQELRIKRPRQRSR